MILLPYLPVVVITLMILGIFALYKKIAVTRKGDKWMFFLIWVVTCGPSLVSLALAKFYWT